MTAAGHLQQHTQYEGNWVESMLVAVAVSVTRTVVVAVELVAEFLKHVLVGQPHHLLKVLNDRRGPVARPVLVTDLQAKPQTWPRPQSSHSHNSTHPSVQMHTVWPT